AGGGADWRRDWTLAHGLLVNAVAATEFDFYRVWDDPATPERVIGRATPIVSTELRWPLLRTTGRAAHVVEPIAQIVYSDIIGETDNPNEDSQLPEFDTTNLFVLNRYPGRDRYETGLRANLGISYTRYDPSGWSLGLTAGRVLRADGDTSFPEDSGLDGRWSDYVTSVALTTAWGLTLSDQALFGDDFLFRRNEFAVVYDGDRADFAASYVYFAEDDTNEVLGPQPETNEFSIDARYRVHPNWEVRGLWRYDIASDSNLRAGAGITYGTQCAEFDLSVSRRFTSSDNVPPSTSIGFNVSLAGLGDSEDRSWPARVCLG
ncbi:MAG TPA: LPS assembly protein LptD, partial [Amaricoccus sp.]|nr:LPS assembly protein LptD [Amaricoccus sp.]